MKISCSYSVIFMLNLVQNVEGKCECLMVMKLSLLNHYATVHAFWHHSKQGRGWNAKQQPKIKMYLELSYLIRLRRGGCGKGYFTHPSDSWNIPKQNNSLDLHRRSPFICSCYIRYHHVRDTPGKVGRSIFRVVGGGWLIVPHASYVAEIDIKTMPTSEQI